MTRNTATVGTAVNIMFSFLKQGRGSWYEVLFGLEEASSYPTAQRNFILNQTAGTMTSKANGKEYQIGVFNTPSLKNLRDTAVTQLRLQGSRSINFQFDHVVQGDVLLEHAKFPGAVFQAASQFNCLEFSSWKSLPESGVTIYEYDRTQGPACALACAAGTTYRNYLVDVNNMPGDVNLLKSVTPPTEPTQDKDSLDYSRLGQMEHRQINNLDDLERLLQNDENKYFNILNGYTFSADGSKLDRLSDVLADYKRPAADRTISSPELSYDDLLGAVKIGLHSEVGVTFRTRYEPIDPRENVTVTQAYCSALSCAYSGIHNHHWEGLARLVLEANYEATLWAAVLNALKASTAAASTGASAVVTQGEKLCAANGTDSAESTAAPQSHRHEVFLTLLGGGVFQNDPRWICDAIGRALAVMKVHNAPINVHIAHFRNLSPSTVEMVQEAYEMFLSELEQPASQSKL